MKVYFGQSVKVDAAEKTATLNVEGVVLEVLMDVYDPNASYRLNMFANVFLSKDETRNTSDVFVFDIATGSRSGFGPIREYSARTTGRMLKVSNASQYERRGFMALLKDGEYVVSNGFEVWLNKNGQLIKKSFDTARDMMSWLPPFVG